MRQLAKPIVIMVVGLWFSLSVAIAESKLDFVTGTEDVPLMQGLIPLQGDGLQFSAPEGRLIDSYAVAGEAQGKTLDWASVVAFYEEALPGLGWQKSEVRGGVKEGGNAKGKASGKESLTYIRDNEQITIEFKEKPVGHDMGHDFVVHFHIAPLPY